MANEELGLSKTEQRDILRDGYIAHVQDRLIKSLPGLDNPISRIAPETAATINMEAWRLADDKQLSFSEAFVEVASQHIS